jgi:hypothetical protein
MVFVFMSDPPSLDENNPKSIELEAPTILLSVLNWECTNPIAKKAKIKAVIIFFMIICVIYL